MKPRPLTSALVSLVLMVPPLCPPGLAAAEDEGERAPNSLSAEEEAAGFVLLFDGESLDGWKPQAPGFFRAGEGALVADGTVGRSMIYYAGDPDDPEDDSFENFELRLQVRTGERGNSGVYFRTEWQDDGYPDATGYEAQISNTPGNRGKTGSLYAITSVGHRVPDGEWFDYHIIADGPKITAKINGETVTEYTQPEKGAENWKPTADRLALQAHDPAVVEFRNIRIRRLDG